MANRTGKELLTAQTKARADGKLEEFLDSLTDFEADSLYSAELSQICDGAETDWELSGQEDRFR